MNLAVHNQFRFMLMCITVMKNLKFVVEFLEVGHEGNFLNQRGLHAQSGNILSKIEIYKMQKQSRAFWRKSDSFAVIRINHHPYAIDLSWPKEQVKITKTVPKVYGLSYIRVFIKNSQEIKHYKIFSPLNEILHIHELLNLKKVLKEVFTPNLPLVIYFKNIFEPV